MQDSQQGCSSFPWENCPFCYLAPLISLLLEGHPEGRSVTVKLPFLFLYRQLLLAESQLLLSTLKPQV